MPIYWGDYAKDTGHLGAVHHGAYLMLIKHYWVTAKPLPADDKQLWRIACMNSLAAWLKIKAVILAFFDEREGLLHHARIEDELAKAEGNAERRTEMARRAAEARWKKDAPSMPGACPPPSSPPSDNPHGEISTAAARASASPDGPPRTPLPDSAKWAERLAGYRPWEGKRVWQPFWGPRPDSGQQPSLIPAEMRKAWLLEYEAAKKRGEAA
jgi:uncharacterized protein YdaU (DUF1376 family)